MPLEPPLQTLSFYSAFILQMKNQNQPHLEAVLFLKPSPSCHKFLLTKTTETNKSLKTDANGAAIWPNFEVNGLDR